MPNTKLLPCPCCGSKKVSLIRSYLHLEECETDAAWHVECINCGIQTDHYPEVLSQEGDCYDVVVEATNDAIACAVNAWNNRHADGEDYDDCEGCDGCDDHERETPDYLGLKAAMKALDDLCNMVHSWVDGNGK